MSNETIERLLQIYEMIPTFNCLHCHQCCGPIFWSEPEELLIRDFLFSHHMKRIIWSREEFQINDMKCPYLIQHGCAIYPVRPIVCRLQGVLPALPCSTNLIDYPVSQEQLASIYTNYSALIKEKKCGDVFYGTLKPTVH